MLNNSKQFTMLVKIWCGNSIVILADGYYKEY